MRGVKPRYIGKYYCNNCWEKVDPEVDTHKIRTTGENEYFKTECERCGLKGRKGEQMVCVVKIPRYEWLVDYVEDRRDKLKEELKKWNAWWEARLQGRMDIIEEIREGLGLEVENGR